MFKVEFETSREPEYIDADAFHTYDGCLTFYNIVHGLNPTRTVSMYDTKGSHSDQQHITVAAVRGNWSSVIKVDGQPFDPSQSGDTEDDV